MQNRLVTNSDNAALNQATIEIDLTRLPKHIAIIMDGNGRWARAKGYIRSLGHENGVDALRRIATASAELGIEYLTVYAFSTENWKRPKTEVKALMSILVKALRKELSTLLDNNIRLQAIGDISLLPEDIQKQLKEVIALTAKGSRMALTLALSYSSKEEILRATRLLAEDVRKGLLLPENITEQVFENYLYTRGMPHPDLLIRTSGEYRISNYLLWQLAYTELYFSPKLWPDFTKEDLLLAIAEYQKRERRFGLISEQLNENS
ncbi:isoprenyl transferase [Thermaurantimonas aggregans]|uniref:isoprenyl transferase n=1 Tax=Thermaurantimonas aggregans TaxID=2173829 RepID=UPI0023F364AE|nr:isoprenyl transferase [Thermaurantimonas aggregans]MCX8148741.1 isoprenyl transferase [Thermaurantimonas aggregans]